MHITKFHRPLRRRHVLRGMGSIAIGLPLLEVMACDRDEGRAPARVDRRADGIGSRGSVPVDRPLQRFVGTMIPNGVVPLEWFPTGSEHEFETKGIMAALPEHALPGLADHVDDLVILRGLTNMATFLSPEKSHNEGHCTTLTGSVVQGAPGSTPADGWFLPGPSLDQYLADYFEQIAGVPFAKKSLPIATHASFNGTLSWDAQGNAIPPHGSVVALFDELFGLTMLSEAEREALRARRHSVLDSVLGSYTALQKRVGAADRARLEEHLDALRNVELRIDSEIVCDVPDEAAYPDVVDGLSGAGLPQAADLMQDLLVLAFACDVTRVATITYRPCGGGSSYLPWLGFSADDYATGEHHEMSHRHLDPAWDPALVLAAQWFCGLTASLISKLKAVQEGTGTLFDSVILLQGSDVATGLHNLNDMPYLLAGSGAGVLDTGRYLQFPETAHNALLVSILQAMGLPDTTFGEPSLQSGPLPGLV